MQSKIIEIFQSITSAGTDIDVKTYAKEINAVLVAEKQLFDEIRENEKLRKLVENFDEALGICHVAENEQFYKLGFIDGAKIMKEICE